MQERERDRASERQSELNIERRERVRRKKQILTFFIFPLTRVRL